MNFLFKKGYNNITKNYADKSNLYINPNRQAIELQIIKIVSTHMNFPNITIIFFKISC